MMFFFIKVPKDKLEETENYYISKFKPKYNKTCLGVVKISNVRPRVKRLLNNKNCIKNIPNMPKFVKKNYEVFYINDTLYTKEDVVFKISDILNKEER